MTYFTKDCARSSHLKGNNVAFDLVDKVFTRAFFDDVSWSGIVKKSCKKKTCFSQFNRIREFFFNLCYSVDKNYSRPMCDEWLKNVAIRTSSARMLVKGIRVSRTKNRKRSFRCTAPSKTDDDSENDHSDKESKMDVIPTCTANIDNSASIVLPSSLFATPIPTQIGNVVVHPPAQLTDDFGATDLQSPEIENTPPSLLSDEDMMPPPDYASSLLVPKTSQRNAQLDKQETPESKITSPQKSSSSENEENESEDDSDVLSDGDSYGNLINSKLSGRILKTLSTVIENYLLYYAFSRLYLTVSSFLRRLPESTNLCDDRRMRVWSRKPQKNGMKLIASSRTRKNDVSF